MKYLKDSRFIQEANHETFLALLNELLGVGPDDLDLDLVEALPHSDFVKLVGCLKVAPNAALLKAFE